MFWTSAVSRNPVAEEAIVECIAKVKESLSDRKASILFVFSSSHHSHAYQDIANAINEALDPEHLLGCSGGGIIGNGEEVERASALSITAAVLPGVDIKTFRLTTDKIPDLDGGPRSWIDLIGVPPSEQPQFIVLADPFSFRADDFLRGLDFAFADSPKVGGLASGATAPGENVLYCDDAVEREGCVGLAMTGDIKLEPLVAQGCRPIGKPYSISKCRKNMLFGLDGHSPIEQLAEIFGESDERDRKLIRTSLFLGVVMDPFKKSPPRHGDFLIRNIIGADPKKGSLAIGAMLRQGQVVQFHLRDSYAAAEDLIQVLRRYTAEMLKEGQGEAVPHAPAAAMLFSCVGRGQHLFGAPHHDSTVFKHLVADVPIGGFFCNGEIGPVGGTTYLHGFTSCFAIFRSK